MQSITQGMENVHTAIAWYQKKIGSYDKQLWEQSVEKKLQKGLPNVRHAPRKTVRLKTEYIDVDLIRGSTFTKTKPQVPWIYITRKAFVRVLFFPFYYKWWVHQTSWKVFTALLTLYTLQVITSVVYFRNVDGSIIEDELALTEVVVPMSLMFFLGLIHSQTVLAHFSLKPPRRGARLRKAKKRQRQTGFSDQCSDTADRRDKSRSSDRRRTSPPRTMPVINTIWNVPRVEVSAADQTGAQTTISERRGVLHGRSSSRSARKNVRILEQVQRFGDSTSRSSDIIYDFDDSLAYISMDDIPPATIEGGSGGEGVSTSDCRGNVEQQEVPQMRRAQDDLHQCVNCPHPCKVLGGNNNSDVDGGEDAGSALPHASICHGCDIAPIRDDCCDVSCPAPIRDDCCDVSCPVDVSRGLKDTSDSDSVAGKFEFVNIDAKERPVLCAPECPAQSSVSVNSRSDELHRNKFVLRGSASEPSTLHDGSSNSDLESLPHLLVRGVRGDRGSVSEDAQDQKDDDNLSDAGHVSNSSNYNPSDSEPETDAEGDNLDDSLRLVTNKILIAASENPNMDVSSVQSSSALGSSASPCPALQSLTLSPRKMAQQQNQQEAESSASEPGSPDARLSPLSGGLRRRRRQSSNQGSAEQGETTRARPMPPKLLSMRAQSKNTQTSGVSSSENEAGQLSPDSANKANVSSEEWEDRMQSDMTTSSSYSTSNSESELSDNNIGEEEEEEDLHDVMPNGFPGLSFLPPPSMMNAANVHSVQPDKVSCVIWEGNECKKVDLTALDIGWAIIDKVDNLPESSDYIFIGLALSICLGCVPLAYRLYFAKDLPIFLSWTFLEWLWTSFKASSWRQNLLIINGIIQRLMLSCIFFFLLTVTDRTFKQRLLYAKHFSYLTSSRRARKFDMPHFRLSKVRNIKIWLSLRSYLKRRGPQRSVDVIVSASFYSSISLLCLMCLQMLKDADTYLDYLCNWELVVWCIALGIYIMRFMTLGLKINKKYRNLSVLITEQINLYLQMEQKPHKKEELILANNVLRLAEDLLKELESPFKISGFSANPLIYNITKVVVLSAFSAVMTELLGFKLKLYKIKLKA